MSQTILIQNNSEERKLLGAALEKNTNTNVINRFDSKDTLELLKILPSVNLIICPQNLENDLCANHILDYLHQNELQIPMIVLGKEKSTTQGVSYLEESISHTQIIQEANALLRVTQTNKTSLSQENFIPIPIQYFYEINSAPCDIFIRIKKQQDKSQYIKRFHSHSDFSTSSIDKYKLQELHEFYISKNHHPHFMSYLVQSILKNFDTDLDFSARLSTNANAYDIVGTYISQKEISKEIIQLAERNIISMIKSIKNSPSLSGLLKFFFAQKTIYSYQKAHLVSTIGNFLMSKQPWYKPQHLNTMTYLSFFADITLQSPREMSVNEKFDLKNSPLGQIEKERIQSHAKEASLIVKQFPSANANIELLTKQHQGSIDGSDFPTEASDKINPMAKIFVIADAFIKNILDPKAPKNKKEILTILYMQFSHKTYQDIIKSLEGELE